MVREGQLYVHQLKTCKDHGTWQYSVLALTNHG